MMRDLQTPSLVLLDEVGTGTDPDEGSALGVAIVDYFRTNGSQIIASTHYKGLKIYATKDDDVINASVEFDEKTLQPTYRLLVGFAGASSGIEIARRFGILPQVIEKSRQVLDKSALEASDYLMRLKRETQIAEDLRIALEEEREATAMKYALLDIEAGKREKERAKEFTAQLSETLDSFEKKTKSFLQTIEDKALKAKMEKEIQTRKAELKRFVFEHESIRKSDGGKIQIPSAFASEPKFKTENRPIVLGDRVLTSFNSVGIVEKIDGGNAEVLVGSMRMREKLKNLKVVSESEVQSPKSKVQVDTQAIDERLETDNFTPELNLIGKRTSEAEYMLDKFLDESYMSSQRQIRIIHGFGTGAMRNFVQSFLRNHAHVLRYTFAEQNQGGEGATIVELKS
jgi:DNA mismatch repair protein MutS2